jgi:glyoxylase-like metal-dependent hydrolase (beta-lactamase superfamily II)
VGDFSLTFLETPGHSDDHGSYLLHCGSWSALVSGDAVFAGGKVILQDILDCSVSGTIATIKKLAAVDFEVFLPGHGPFSLAAGRRHVEAALRHAEMGVPPPNLF